MKQSAAIDPDDLIGTSTITVDTGILIGAAAVTETPPASDDAPYAPAVGDIVLYRLTELDVLNIERRRAWVVDYMGKDRRTIARSVAPHAGSPVTVGEAVAMIVTRLGGDGAINGRCILDGTDDLWVQGAMPGDGVGEFMPVAR